MMYDGRVDRCRRPLAALVAAMKHTGLDVVRISRQSGQDVRARLRSGEWIEFTASVSSLGADSWHVVFNCPERRMEA